MTIPPEIMEQIGITTGDTVKISYGDQGSLIIEKVDKKENSGEEDQEEQE
jgi:antitoxin component of MazEF toxin-antitoxin module